MRLPSNFSWPPAFICFSHWSQLPLCFVLQCGFTQRLGSGIKAFDITALWIETFTVTNSSSSLNHFLFVLFKTWFHKASAWHETDWRYGHSSDRLLALWGCNSRLVIWTQTAKCKQQFLTLCSMLRDYFDCWINDCGGNNLSLALIELGPKCCRTAQWQTVNTILTSVGFIHL